MVWRWTGDKPFSELMLDYCQLEAYKLQWNFNWNSYIFIQENVFERSSGKWRPLCLGLSVLTCRIRYHFPVSCMLEHLTTLPGAWVFLAACPLQLVLIVYLVTSVTGFCVILNLNLYCLMGPTQMCTNLGFDSYNHAIWALSQYEDGLPRYGDFHYEDKTVIRLSYFYNRNPYSDKTAPLYWDRPQVFCAVFVYPVASLYREILLATATVHPQFC